ncbi:SRPBCC domain-containing protein [Streptomyces laurentii]|uniref:SRPBCC domain-containing protein n=1 Tax=Streptomyces laurentii TaxID=39478 RepID=UPI0036AFCF34
MTEIPRGRSETHDIDRHLLRYVVELPHPMVRVWHAVATPGGLARWLYGADPLEPRLGGRVTFRRPDGAEAARGRVTAWDPEYIAEYTIDPPGPDSGTDTGTDTADTADLPRGRIRFHLEPGPDDATGSAVLRFTAEFRGTREERLDRLADWHDRLERLAAVLDEALAGNGAKRAPGAHRRELREAYARDEALWPVWEP